MFKWTILCFFAANQHLLVGVNNVRSGGDVQSVGRIYIAVFQKSNILGR